MRHRLLYLITDIVFIFFAISIFRTSAGERLDSLSLKVYFRQNGTELDPDYRGNGMYIEKFISEVGGILSDPGCRVQEICIRSGASPEGSFGQNMELSLKRGLVLRDALQELLLLPDEKFVIDAVGENWAGLREKVERNSVPDRERILEILDRHADYVNGRPASYYGGPKKELMELNYGRTWNWLLENVYPDLRSAGNTVVCRYTRTADTVYVEREPRVTGHVIDTIVIVHHYLPGSDTTGAYGAYGAYGAAPVAGYPLYPEGYAPKYVRVKKERTGPKYRFAIQTNLLLDAVLSPNLKAEFPIGRRVSVLGFHHFPWYIWGDNRFAYQIMNTGVEARWWLGDRSRRSVLTGGYVGLYGATGKSDLEYDSEGYQVPRTWHAGVTGGWSFPLGRSDNWRLELGLSVGYLPYSYDYYRRNASGVLIYKSSGEGRWIGPTDVRCSIVWMLPMNKKVPKPAKEAEAEKDQKKAKADRPADKAKKAKKAKASE